MTHSAQLRRLLSLAIDAGDTAAAETQQLVANNTDPDQLPSTKGRALVRLLRGRALAWEKAGPAPTANQVRRACELIDFFSEALTELNTCLGPQGACVKDLSGLSATLWDSNDSSADVHNEVVAMLATLGRYRTNIILDRSLLSK